MALLWTEGFDAFSSLTDFGSMYSYTASSNANQISGLGLVLNAGRFNTSTSKCIAMLDTGSGFHHLPGPVASGVFGCAVYLGGTSNTSSWRLLCFCDGVGEQFRVNINTSNQLTLCPGGSATPYTNGTSSVAMTPYTWYYVEVKFVVSNSISTNTCSLRVNGLTVATPAAGSNFRASTSNNYINRVILGQGSQGSGMTTAYDDCYLCDQTGSTNNDFLGDVRVESIFPNAVGTTTQFTNSAGNSTNNYSYLTSLDADTSYVAASTANKIDTYNMANIVTSKGTVYGVQSNIYHRKSAAGTSPLAPVMCVGGTNYVGNTIYSGDSYLIDNQIYETNPNTGVAWTISDVNNVEFGFKKL